MRGESGEGVRCEGVRVCGEGVSWGSCEAVLVCREGVRVCGVRVCGEGGRCEV